LSKAESELIENKKKINERLSKQKEKLNQIDDQLEQLIKVNNNKNNKQHCKIFKNFVVNEYILIIFIFIYIYIFIYIILNKI